MSIFTKIILEGKIYKPDLKRERYVNYLVMFGFALLFTWMLFLYPNVFIDIRLVLLLLFLPGLLLTPILYKTLLSISGYKYSIKDNLKYNFIIAFLAYMLVTIPAGNFVVTSFLSCNYLFAQQEIKTIIVEPFGIGESTSKESRDIYSHLDVEYDGIIKQFNFGKTPIDTIINKSLRIAVSKGLFGYYIVRNRTLIPKQSW